MPLIDKPLAELRTYTGRNPRPTDFDSYWDKSIAEMKALGTKAELVPAKFTTPVAECFDLYFTGVGGSHVVLRQLRRVVARHRLERVAGIARIEVVEYPADPTEEPAAALHRLDRIGEARRLRRCGDRRDFRELLRHAAIEGGGKMLGSDAVEGRQLERRRPGFEEGIVAH